MAPPLTRLLAFRVPARSVEEFSDAAWEQAGVLGLEELPLSGETLFKMPPGFEILEFGSEAAKRCAEWLESEGYRGTEDMIVRIYVETAADGTGFLAENFAQPLLTRIPGSELLSSAVVDPRDYLEEYRKTVRGFSIGEGLWVGPPWDAPPAGLQAFIVEPGLAFGTGDHPTTQLCLEALARLQRAGVRPKNILDLGTGSGILAAACRKFFPDARIKATDLDPACEAEVAKTFGLNGLDATTITMAFGPQGSAATCAQQGERYDLIVSNIYAEVLALCVPPLARLLIPEGLWIASGILGGPSEEILTRAYGGVFRVRRRTTRDRESLKLDRSVGLQSDKETWVGLELEFVENR